MPVVTDTTEKGLEAYITQHLSLVNGFEERHFDQYNRTECVDEELLFRFLDDTQPAAIDRESESSLNRFSSAAIPDEFKKANNRFLIVANKYQTGFDQPFLHTMVNDLKINNNLKYY